MPQRLRLEVFDLADERDRPGPVVLDREAIEDVRLAAFEEGYRAGWDDAAASRAETDRERQQRLSWALTALAAAREALRAELLAALRPVLEAMVAAVLPATARAALPPQIAEAVLPLAAQAAGAPIDLVVHPDTASEVEAGLLELGGDVALRLIEDPEVPPGDAVLRLGAAETRIAADAAIAEVARLAIPFFDRSGRETRDG